MIIIDLHNIKNIDIALKIYKSKINKIKQIKQLRDRQEYIKPSVKRREEIQKSIYKTKNGLI